MSGGWSRYTRNPRQSFDGCWLFIILVICLMVVGIAVSGDHRTHTQEPEARL